MVSQTQRNRGYDLIQDRNQFAPKTKRPAFAAGRFELPKLNEPTSLLMEPVETNSQASDEIESKLKRLVDFLERIVGQLAQPSL